MTDTKNKYDEKEFNEFMRTVSGFLLSNKLLVKNIAFDYSDGMKTTVTLEDLDDDLVKKVDESKIMFELLKSMSMLMEQLKKD